MASMDIYVNKLKKGFRFFDLNKNGYLTKEEVMKCADVICSLASVTGAERDETKNQWKKWCDAILPEGEVNEEIYLARCQKLITQIPEIMWQENIVTSAIMFDRLDANKDGFISPEEIWLYYKAFGYGDDYDIDQIFRMMDDNNDGLISHDEFTHAAATFWSQKPGYEYFCDPQKKKGTA